MYKIIYYDKKYEQEVIDLILNIQQNEFNVPITIEEQPDLRDVAHVYQTNKGNFWIALDEKTEAVVGTIALIDGQKGLGAIRKMFVRADTRGSGIAQKLLDELLEWAQKHEFSELMLGTIERLVAARKFYVRNDFSLIDAQDLPPHFPRMAVDTLFYRRVL